MSAAVVIALVVAAGEASSPATIALRLAAEEALGAGAAIRVLERSDLGAVDALAIEQSAGARAVVVLAWREPAHLNAQLRIQVAGAEGWTTRALSFAPEDSLAERGRTLGLAVASMWPESVEGRARSRDAPVRADAIRRQPEAAPDAKAPRPTPATVNDEPRAHSTRGQAGEPAATASGTSVALGAAAAGTVGLGGPATGIGVTLEAVLSLADVLALRLGAGLRTGPVAALPGTDLVGSLAGGLEWWPRPHRRAEVGLRADILVLRHQVSDVTQGTTETRRRTLPGADVVAQVRLRLNARLDLVGGVGAEIAFGATDLRTGQPPVVVTTIPALRAVSQLGLRVGF